MKPSRRLVFVFVLAIIPLFALAQVEKIVIPAGTPEDQALTAISNEPDAEKKLPMYQEFAQKFSANPAAVAYANWQISQYYDNAGDSAKAIEYGDKALAGSPRNLDIIVSQANIAQRAKLSAKLFDYCVRGAEIYNSISKEAKPEGVSDQDFASRINQEKASARGSFEFFETAAYNAIIDESNAKTRMGYIERFTPAFPDSRFGDAISSYAMMALAELKDNARLLSYAEKTLAANPGHLPTLLLLANFYADDSKPGSSAKAITYAQKAIAAAKADAPDADDSHKLSAGVAHSTLGYAYMKDDKNTLAVPELKAAVGLIRGLDDQQFAIAAYRLGFAYGKLNRMAEAKEILQEAVKIDGPMKPLNQDLLSKVSVTKARAK